MRQRLILGIAVPAACFCAASASGQVGLSQADPSIVVKSIPKIEDPVLEPDTVILGGPSPADAQVTPKSAPVASSIVVAGAPELARSAFADAIVPYLARELSARDLSSLSTAIADAARAAGYPLASAWIERQSMTDGILRVRLELGKLSAVRVIGATNTLADRILSKALITGRPARSRDLERAILLVGDIPGVSVKESRYVRQDGFGILLITIAEDRASLYAQVDNRGSAEVGPIRSTLLASLRGILQSGDELGLISAQTPLQPSEFFFLRARYTAPVDLRGATFSLSGSYGRARPGASLTPLRVIGKSYDGSLNYAVPLIRNRKQSLWASLDLRSLQSSQTLLDSPLRNDRLTTLTGALSGNSRVGLGAVRGNVALVIGLPLPGMTRQGDRRISRSDGDSRFVTIAYDLDWTAHLAERLSFVLSSQGQVASRPLLATAEIGVGGPVFGRGYDYAERTGDTGVLGGAELRADLGELIPGVVERVQIYGTVDGGYVDNLRDGSGGGALLSTAAGVRVGRGKLDGMIEVALPLNQDRFDTQDRRPRVSFRLARGI